jgi:ABC-type branched-subunit amino acid transport system ATPase component
MEHTVIDIQNAVVSYREDIALRGVSLKVKDGEFVGIIGPNGAGKTTLFNVFTGMLIPERGKILFGNTDITGLKPFQICKWELAGHFS